MEVRSVEIGEESSLAERTRGRADCLARVSGKKPIFEKRFMRAIYRTSWAA